MTRPSYVPDAETVAALKVSREVGRQCLTCGKPHTYREIICSCHDLPDREHPHWTWASPEDGHGYRPRADTEWMTALIEEAERE